MEMLLTVHAWGGIFTSGGWRGQRAYITQESQLDTLWDGRLTAEWACSETLHSYLPHIGIYTHMWVP